MEAATADCSSWQEPKQADCATRLQQADCDYPSTAKVWQTLNIGKAPGIPNNLIIFGAVHGQMSRHCLGVVCQTLPVLRYPASPWGRLHSVGRFPWVGFTQPASGRPAAQRICVVEIPLMLFCDHILSL